MRTIQVDQRERDQLERAYTYLERVFKDRIPIQVGGMSSTLRRLVAKYDHPEAWPAEASEDEESKPNVIAG